MRLWSIHPKYLDAKGLVALWRESLLAQKVLQGETGGYKNHPQLVRFRASQDPLGAIAEYLRHVETESRKRGYAFDSAKIMDKRAPFKIEVTSGQVDYEVGHLLKKLETRAPELHKTLKGCAAFELHPLFVEVDGEVQEWEAVK